jgi:uncharacterized protein YcbX
MAASSLVDDTLIAMLPDGSTVTDTGDETDRALSAWLEKPVSLVDAREVPASEAEFFADATDDASEAVAWTMPAGRFVDALPLLVLTTASLRAGADRHAVGDWNVRRFRPNVLVEADGDDWLEDAWVGHELHIGDVVLTVVAPCARCTMVTRPQPGLARDLDVFKTLAREHGGSYGVWAAVTTPGVVRVDMPVAVG